MNSIFSQRTEGEIIFKNGDIKSGLVKKLLALG